LVEWCRFCFVDLANASDVDAALQLSGQEFKGTALKIEVSQKKSQTETPGKQQEKGPKPGKTPKAKAVGQEHPDKGELGFHVRS